jgi:hypothetical protein
VSLPPASGAGLEHGDVFDVESLTAAAPLAANDTPACPPGITWATLRSVVGRGQPAATAAGPRLVVGQWQVTPIGLDYRLNDGSVSEEIAYWRDMTFFPHFLNLLSKEKIFARVSFGEPRPPGEDRKVLAPELHDSVVALRLAQANTPQTSSVAA